jgi:PAS domain S-box-containing protein
VPDHESDPWREALLESSLDCVIIMDASGLIVDVNRGTVETFGVPRDQAVGRTLAEVFVPPELREQHNAGLARYLATGESRILGTRVEVPALHASGRRIPVELSIVRLRSTSPPLFVGHLRTIEARQRSQRRLRVSAAVHSVLATAGDADAAVSQTMSALGEALGWLCVQYWATAADDASVQLRSWWERPDHVPGLTPLRTVSAFAAGEGLPGAVLATAAPIWIEDLSAAANFPRSAQTAALGVHTAIGLPVDVGGRIVGVIEAFSGVPESRDEELVQLLAALGSQLGHVMEQSAVRVEREALLAREQAANRLKDEFLAVVSHELRTPLAPIVGWARMLRDPKASADQLRAGLESIERNAVLETHLVEDLLDVSRMMAGKFSIEPVRLDPAAPLAGAAEGARASARDKGVDLRVEIAAALPAVAGDPQRLQQVFSNLLSNAIKFTPDGGQVAVAAREAEGWLHVTVTDTGIGIPAEFLPHVFDRFRQADGRSTRAAGGLGLGLSIVRDLVAAHGGTVAVQSAGPGLGATVTVKLPPYQMSPTVKPSGNGS